MKKIKTNILIASTLLLNANCLLPNISFAQTAYITNNGTDSVSVINVATNTVRAKIAVGTFPYGVAVSPDGTKVYVTNENANAVSVINTATNTISATILVGAHPVSFGNFISTHTQCNLSVTAGPDASTFYGYTGDQQVTRTAIVTGGTAPYTYSWTLGRPLKCNVITSSGDEIFSGGSCTNTVCPTTGTLAGIATCSGSATVTLRLVDTTNVCVTVTDAKGCTALGGGRP